jgi:hypothetical protein
VNMAMIGERRLWICSLLGAIGLAGATTLLFRSPSFEREPDQLSKKSIAPNIALKRVVSQDAVLLDKTPLFLPTDLNTSAIEVSLPKTGGVFSDFLPIFSFSEVEVGLGGMRASEGVLAGDALGLSSGAPVALGFGRQSSPATAIDSRRYSLDVLAAKDGALIFREVLASSPPRANAIWQPLEFMALIGSAGLQGPLVSITRSGSDDLDAYFADYLAKELKLGARLFPGTYRLIVGP